MASGRAEPESEHGSARRVRVLFLGANPDSTERLRLDREARGIGEKIQSSKHRSSVQLIQRGAVRVDDLLQALLEEEPDVVHFSGHGTPGGEIVLEDEDGSPKAISREAFANVFRVLKDRVRVVVLNASHSRAQAEAVARHIDCAVGMNNAMPQSAAIEFAAAFYLAIGFGRSVQTAFELGVSALELKRLDGADVPELFARRGVIPSEVTLVESSPSTDVAPQLKPQLRRLVGVPELPPNFLPRASDLERLKVLVLGGSAKAVGLTGPEATSMAPPAPPPGPLRHPIDSGGGRHDLDR
jgi:hypothetical protein